MLDLPFKIFQFRSQISNQRLKTLYTKKRSSPSNLIQNFIRNRFFPKKSFFSHLNYYKQLLRDNWVQKTLKTYKVSISVPEKSKIIITFVKQQFYNIKMKGK